MPELRSAGVANNNVKRGRSCFLLFSKCYRRTCLESSFRGRDGARQLDCRPRPGQAILLGEDEQEQDVGRDWASHPSRAFHVSPKCPCVEAWEGNGIRLVPTKDGPRAESPLPKTNLYFLCRLPISISLSCDVSMTVYSSRFSTTNTRSVC